MAKSPSIALSIVRKSDQHFEVGNPSVGFQYQSTSCFNVGNPSTHRLFFSRRCRRFAQGNRQQIVGSGSSGDRGRPATGAEVRQ